jgi:hypothetical protein
MGMRNGCLLHKYSIRLPERSDISWDDDEVVNSILHVSVVLYVILIKFSITKLVVLGGTTL